MNDCIFCAMMICECENCRCEKYLSMNSGKGRQIEKEYSDKIDEAIVPIKKEMQEKYYDIKGE